jgi:hypothetical protein
MSTQHLGMAPGDWLGFSDEWSSSEGRALAVFPGLRIHAPPGARIANLAARAPAAVKHSARKVVLFTE